MEKLKASWWCLKMIKPWCVFSIEFEATVGLQKEWCKSNKIRDQKGFQGD